jgi:hypothetical protein
MQNFSFTCDAIDVVTKSGALQGGDSTEISAALKLQSPRGIRPKVGVALERSKWIVNIAATGGAYGREAISSVGKARRLNPRPESEATTYLVHIYLNSVQFDRVFKLATSGFQITSIELEIDEVEEEGFEAVAWGDEPSGERCVLDFEATWAKRAPDTASEA